MLRWRIRNTIFPNTASRFPPIPGQILTQKSATWDPQKFSKHLNWTREEIGKFFALLCEREQNNVGTHNKRWVSFIFLWFWFWNPSLQSKRLILQAVNQNVNPRSVFIFILQKYTSHWKNMKKLGTENQKCHNFWKPKMPQLQENSLLMVPSDLRYPLVWKDFFRVPPLSRPVSKPSPRHLPSQAHPWRKGKFVSKTNVSETTQPCLGVSKNSTPKWMVYNS